MRTPVVAGRRWRGVGLTLLVQALIGFKIDLLCVRIDLGPDSAQRQSPTRSPPRALIGGAQPSSGWWAPVAQRHNK